MLYFKPERSFYQTLCYTFYKVEVQFLLVLSTALCSIRQQPHHTNNDAMVSLLSRILCVELLALCFQDWNSKIFTLINWIRALDWNFLMMVINENRQLKKVRKYNSQNFVTITAKMKVLDQICWCVKEEILSKVTSEILHVTLTLWN